MTNFEEDTRAPDAPKQYTEFITVPINRPCWVVWDDGAIDGPHVAVAICTAVEAEEHSGTIRKEHHRDAEGRDRTSYEIYYPRGGVFQPEAFDYSHCRVLVLPDEFAKWESPWFEQKHVVFSEAAANGLSAERQAKVAAANGLEVQRSLTGVKHE